MAKTTLINHETGYSSSFVTEDDKSIIHSVQNVKNVIDHANATKLYYKILLTHMTCNLEKNSYINSLGY